MQQTVESNNTLLVDGPASVQVASGKVEVFGYQVKDSSKVVVREGKRLPFFVVEKAVFDVSLGANASVQEVAGSTIPQSWIKSVEAVLSLQTKPVTVLVLGKGDSGKSSLCTFLVNKLIDSRCRVGVVDGDIGQSDIGPSGTVGYAVASKPITELYNLRLINACFVGVTSPIEAIAKIVEGLAAMKAELMQRQVDFLVINTDGWVVGDIAIRYKTALIKKLNPDVIVGVQVESELEPLITNLEKPVITVEASSALNQRTAEKRKGLREMTYARYLKNARVQCYPMSQVTIEPIYAIPRDQEPEKGLLVGIYGLGSKFLGIGVLRQINERRKALKVQTAIRSIPRRIVLGKVFIDQKLREVSD